jgi:hypothetical protein
MNFSYVSILYELHFKQEFSELGDICVSTKDFLDKKFLVRTIVFSMFFDEAVDLTLAYDVKSRRETQLSSISGGLMANGSMGSLDPKTSMISVPQVRDWTGKCKD